MRSSLSRDDADIEESWSHPGKMEDVLAAVADWDPRCAAVLSKAPSCVDWKLVYREPYVLIDNQVARSSASSHSQKQNTKQIAHVDQQGITDGSSW